MRFLTRQGRVRMGPPKTALGAIVALASAATIAAVLVLPLWLAIAESHISDPPNLFQAFKTDTGVVQTVKGPNCTHPDNGAAGADICTTSNPFTTENFGTGQGNGQDCETCHQPQLAWSITPRFLKDQFNDTK